MANIVQLKRSSVANKIPETANVAVGEPVVNLVDKVLYTKNGSNAIIVIGAGTTSNIAEGVNLYFTNSRSRSSISVSGSGGSYDVSTGVINLSLDAFPTGDYGDFTQVIDAFGVSTVIGFDCNSPGSLSETDLGILV